MAGIPEKQFMEGRKLRVTWNKCRRTLDRLGAWRWLFAFGLALVTYRLVDNQMQTSPYALWRVVENVPVQVEDDAFDNIYIIPNQSFAVSLVLAVDALHFGMNITPADFEIKVNAQRLKFLLKDVPSRTEALTIVYEIQPADIMTKPGGVDIREIKNAKLKILCDRTSRREVPVRLKLNRERQEKGWGYDCQIVAPSVVSVQGPAFLVNQLAELESEPIVLEGTQPYRGMANLKLDSEMTKMYYSHTQVEYNVVPQKESGRTTVRAFKDVRICFLNRGDSRLRPILGQDSDAFVQLQLKGPNKVVNSMDPEHLRVICDLTPFTLEGGQKVKLQVFGLPEGVQVERILPDEVLNMQLAYQDSLPESVREKENAEQPETTGVSGPAVEGASEVP